MNIVLISVPHTGTWFTLKLFERAGMVVEGLTPPKVEENRVFHGHMLKGTQISAALGFARTMPLVIPLRHPYRVEQSWTKRHKNIHQMVECFRYFIDKFWPLNPLIMPVDSPRREEALQALSDGLGMKLTTDWSVVNGRQGCHKLKLEDCQPSKMVMELVEEMQPILARWY